MSDISKKFKQFFINSTEAVKKTASSAAEATNYKMTEMNQLSKRRTLISELGEAVYMLFVNGLELPEELSELFEQIVSLDRDLETLRAEHAARKGAPVEKNDDTSSKDAPAPEAEDPSEK